MRRCRSLHPEDRSRCELRIRHDGMHQYSYSQTGDDSSTRAWPYGARNGGARIDMSTWIGGGCCQAVTTKTWTA